MSLDESSSSTYKMNLKKKITHGMDQVQQKDSDDYLIHIDNPDDDVITRNLTTIN